MIADGTPAAGHGPAQQAALAVAQLFVAHPGGGSDRLRTEVTRALSRRQLVEVTADVTAWSQQKVKVALGDHPPVDAARLTALHFDAGGRAVIG